MPSRSDAANIQSSEIEFLSCHGLREWLRANTDGATAKLVEDRINQVSEALNQVESRL